MYSMNYWYGADIPYSQHTNADVFAIGAMALEIVIGTTLFRTIYKEEAGRDKAVKPIQQLLLCLARMDSESAIEAIVLSGTMTPSQFRQNCARMAASVDPTEQGAHESFLGSEECPTSFSFFCDVLHCLNDQPVGQLLMLFAIRCMYGGNNINNIVNEFQPFLEQFSNNPLPQDVRMIEVPVYKRSSCQLAAHASCKQLPPTASIDLPFSVDPVRAFTLKDVTSEEFVHSKTYRIPAVYEGVAQQASSFKLCGARLTNAVSRTSPGICSLAENKHSIKRCLTLPGTAANVFEHPGVPARLAFSTALTAVKPTMSASVNAAASSMSAICSQMYPKETSVSDCSKPKDAALWMKVKTLWKTASGKCSTTASANKRTATATTTITSRKTKKGMFSGLKKKLACCFTGVSE